MRSTLSTFATARTEASKIAGCRNGCRSTCSFVRHCQGLSLQGVPAGFLPPAPTISGDTAPLSLTCPAFTSNLATVHLTLSPYVLAHAKGASTLPSVASGCPVLAHHTSMRQVCNSSTNLQSRLSSSVSASDRPSALNLKSQNLHHQIAVGNLVGKFFWGSAAALSAVCRP